MDAITGVEGFGVDHYRPKREFPALVCEYLNLFYACNRCNAFKGDFWPNPAQGKAGQLVPNPCEHVMFDHLRYAAGKMVGTSPAGLWTVELLDLNDPQGVAFREAFLTVLELLRSQIRKSTETVGVAKQQHLEAKSIAEKARTADALTKAVENLATLRKTELTLLGA